MLFDVHLWYSCHTCTCNLLEVSYKLLCMVHPDTLAPTKLSSWTAAFLAASSLVKQWWFGDIPIKHSQSRWYALGAEINQIKKSCTFFCLLDACSSMLSLVNEAFKSRNILFYKPNMWVCHTQCTSSGGSRFATSFWNLPTRGKPKSLVSSDCIVNDVIFFQICYFVNFFQEN